MARGTGSGAGRPTLYEDTALGKLTLSLHPDQLERLRTAARKRLMSASGLLRVILTEWEKRNGLVGPELP